MTRIRRHSMLAVGLFASASLLMSALPAAAADSSAADEWQWEGNLYLWTSEMDVSTQSGASLSIPFSDILDNLDMAFMGGLGASKGKWSFKADIIYLKLSTDVSALKTLPGPRQGEVALAANVGMKSWIVTPTVGYNLIDTEKGSLAVLGGARYLWLNVPIDLTTTVGPITRFYSESPSGTNWDAIVGVRGELNLAPKWFAPFYVDGGGGDSKSTWQGFAGIAYRFDKFDAVGGYRYLNYKFKGGAALNTLTVKGPLLGAAFRF